MEIVDDSDNGDEDCDENYKKELIQKIEATEITLKKMKEKLQQIENRKMLGRKNITLKVDAIICFISWFINKIKIFYIFNKILCKYDKKS